MNTQTLHRSRPRSLRALGEAVRFVPLAILGVLTAFCGAWADPACIRKDENGYHLRQRLGERVEKVYFHYEDTALFVFDVIKGE